MSDYDIKLSENKVGFTILRTSDNITMYVNVKCLLFINYLNIFVINKFRFDSQNIGGFTYSDQFIQLSALLPTKYIYGLGEQRSSLMLDMNWKTYTFFNHDNPPTNGVS